mmetsp:Transcript_20498/g.28638  ORF Transcript_20498/g.28638 Transcript_20498/m.28638 type:complete len:216 (-) Transcript_20498:196-843(-)
MGCHGSCIRSFFPQLDPYQSFIQQTIDTQTNSKLGSPLLKPESDIVSPIAKRKLEPEKKEEKKEPVHWVRYTNEEGLDYYVNTVTGVSRWSAPSSPVVVGVKKRKDEEETFETLQSKMRDTEWVRFVDERSKAEYFKNLRTGKTTWERPDSFADNEQDVYTFRRRHSMNKMTENGAGSEGKNLEPPGYYSMGMPNSAYTSWSSYALETDEVEKRD